MDRIHTLLKPATSRAAVVLPDGILSNGSLKGLRDWLGRRYQMLVVVSLPQHTFRHCDAIMKTNIVFLRRGAERETPEGNELIFRSIVDNLGYDSIGRNGSVKFAGLPAKIRRVTMPISEGTILELAMEHWLEFGLEGMGWRSVEACVWNYSRYYDEFVMDILALAPCQKIAFGV